MTVRHCKWALMSSLISALMSAKLIFDSHVMHLVGAGLKSLWFVFLCASELECVSWCGYRCEYWSVRLCVSINPLTPVSLWLPAAAHCPARSP